VEGDQVSAGRRDDGVGAGNPGGARAFEPHGDHHAGAVRVAQRRALDDGLQRLVALARDHLLRIDGDAKASESAAGIGEHAPRALRERREAADGQAADARIVARV